MPLYEYRCEGCGERFEQLQPVSFRPGDTVCPHCETKRAVRLMSAFASKVVGDHKPGFQESKAYNMLNERMSKFAKLPKPWGKRLVPGPENFGTPTSSPTPPTRQTS